MSASSACSGEWGAVNGTYSRNGDFSFADAPMNRTASWAISVVSGDVFERGVARHALERGGHLRVGLEDYAGPDAPSNEELVRQAVGLAAEVGRPVASPKEAAVLLNLPQPTGRPVA